MKIKKEVKNPKLKSLDKVVEVLRVEEAKGLMGEFKEFLNEYKILGIAAGLVIGSAVTALTQSLVVGLITPLLQLVMPADSFKNMVYTVNDVKFQYGMVINALINFVVVAILFFIFVKVFMKKSKVTKDVLNK